MNASSCAVVRCGGFTDSNVAAETVLTCAVDRARRVVTRRARRHADRDVRHHEEVAVVGRALIVRRARVVRGSGARATARRIHRRVDGRGVIVRAAARDEHETRHDHHSHSSDGTSAREIRRDITKTARCQPRLSCARNGRWRSRSQGAHRPRRGGLSPLVTTVSSAATRFARHVARNACPST